MFKFANNLKTVTEMKQNPMVRLHGNQVVETLAKIVILLTKSSISEKDKDTLVELGKKHYHIGLKIEHFKVFCLEIFVEF